MIYKLFTYSFYIIVIFIILVQLNIIDIHKEVGMKDIEKYISKNSTYYNKIQVDETNGKAYLYLTTTDKEQVYHYTTISKIKNFEDVLKDKINITGIDIEYKTSKSLYSYVTETLTIIFVLYILFFVVNKFFNGDSVIGSLLTSDGKNFTLVHNEKSRFKSVIGLENVKEDMELYIDYFKNREEYIKNGCKIPTGIIFTGAPGTGKTLLAKALAGESGVTFLSASGGDFMEMLVGLGAKRIKKLFELGRKVAPTIIFIDEIDSIGKNRNNKYKSNSEQDTTLNALLSEMDGFKDNEDILVIAATNLIETLDPALTRSGRFDKKVIFDKPNKDERSKMFKLYIDDISVDIGFKQNEEKNITKLSRSTAGLTGADIKNITNHAIIAYMKRKCKNVECEDGGATYLDFENAIADVSIGMVKKERTMTEKEKEVVAHHEAGHSIVAYLLKECEPPIKVSIIPRGLSALGYSQQEPTDKKLYRKEELLAQICVLFGGRVAEQLSYDSITTGASDDIERLTKIAYNIVTNYGMSNFGTINTNIEEYKISSKTQDDVDENIKSIVDKCRGITYRIIEKHKDYMKKIGEYLLEHEELKQEDIDNIFEDNYELKNSISIEDFF